MNRRVQRAITALLCTLFVLIVSLRTSGAQGGNDQAVAATVNGDKITVGEWIRRMQNLRAQDFVASANPVRFKGSTGGQLALDALISGRLLMQYAAKTSLLPSDAEVALGVANAKKRPDIAQALQQGRFTEDELRKDVLLQSTFFSVATVNVSVSQEEIKSYYDRHAEQWGRPERWRLALIRMATKEKTDKAMAALKANVPFETVAAQMSEDPVSSKKGGEVGQFTPTDPSLPDYLREAIKKLKLGEHTEPLQGQAQAGSPVKPPYFIVRLIGKDPAFAQPLESVKDEVRRLALLEKANGAGGVDKKLADFRKTSKIEIQLPGYK